MPANTWTPTALASNAKPWRGSGWRAVEAQHKVATLHLVHGSLKDQALLEDILDEVKPLPPDDTAGLHWLLATPFRYRPLPGGSRFRRREDPGVFYGAKERETACAESGYWRLRFWRDSAGLAQKPKSLQMTLFAFRAASKTALDLTTPPLNADRKKWMRPNDYRATQKLALAAREAGIEVIRYASVRHPGGLCLALLTPLVFKHVKEAYRGEQQTWSLLIQPPDLIVWQRELTNESWSFRFE